MVRNGGSTWSGISNKATDGLVLRNKFGDYPVYWEWYDGNNANNIYPRAWVGDSIKTPLIRLRHLLNVSGINLGNESLEKDFMITPYQYGMGFSYNGVAEWWVREFSIHRGLNYYTDVEENSNMGWGGILWVGDDHDGGGLRMTSRAPISDSSILYSEISSEFFSTKSQDPLRLRVVDTTNQIQFAYGGRGSSSLFAYGSSEANKKNILGSGEKLPLSINVDDTSRIFIKEDGLVGVGHEEPTSMLDILGKPGIPQLRLRTKFTPSASNDPMGNTGDFGWDKDYLYIKNEEGWKRTKLESF